ncbi:hypothetical protein BX600DRAFT_535910, partial [Xylariales sp. PMI_506]
VINIFILHQEYPTSSLNTLSFVQRHNLSLVKESQLQACSSTYIHYITPLLYNMSNQNSGGGLLGGLLGGVDNVLTGGEQAKGQGGLLGGLGGALNSTTQGLGNGLNQTTQGLGNVVGQTTEGVGRTVGGVTGQLGNTVGGLTGAPQQNQKFKSYGI